MSAGAACKPRTKAVPQHELVANSYGDLMLVIPAQPGRPASQARLAVRAAKAEALLLRTKGHRYHLPGLHPAAAEQLAAARSIMITEIDPRTHDPLRAYRVPVIAA